MGKKQKTDLITSSTIEGGRAALCAPPRTTPCSRLRACRTLPRYGQCWPLFSSCPLPRMAAVAKRSNLVGKIMVRSEYKHHMLGVRVFDFAQHDGEGGE